MKILVDMNLSPDWVEVFEKQEMKGIETSLLFHLLSFGATHVNLQSVS